jgi:hypothetical protein
LIPQVGEPGFRLLYIPLLLYLHHGVTGPLHCRPSASAHEPHPARSRLMVTPDDIKETWPRPATEIPFCLSKFPFTPRIELSRLVFSNVSSSRPCCAVSQLHRPYCVSVSLPAILPGQPMEVDECWRLNDRITSSLVPLPMRATCLRKCSSPKQLHAESRQSCLPAP